MLSVYDVRCAGNIDSDLNFTCSKNFCRLTVDSAGLHVFDTLHGKLALFINSYLC